MLFLKRQGRDAMPDYLSEVDTAAGWGIKKNGMIDDGRSKSYFCLAAALLQIEQLRISIDEAAGEKDKKSKTKMLKALLQEHADSSGIHLSLDK